MDALPPELLRMILSPVKSRRPYQIGTVLGDEIPYRHTNQFYPTCNEYLRLRLVSKTFCAIVTPFAFESLRIESIETSMSRLTSIANDDFLKAMVKEYEFAFSQEQTPGVYGPGRNEYLYILSLPEEARSKGYERMSSATRSQVEHFSQQLEFQESGELYKSHISSLPLLPNLQRLRISVIPYTTLSDVPSRTAHWGPVVFQSFLNVLGARALRADIKQIRELSIKGLTGECLILTPKTLSAGIAGFAHLKTLDITLAAIHENCLIVLGCLLQSATSLQRLELRRHGGTLEDADDVPTVQLSPLFTKPNVERSVCAGGKLPFNSHRWLNLQTLILTEFVFTPKLFLDFYQKHHKTLTCLNLSNCYLRPESPPCPLHSAYEDSAPKNGNLSDDAPQLNTWQHVFRQLKRLSNLQYCKLSTLSAGRDAHSHLNPKESLAWEAYLTGKHNDEPVHDPDDKSWCTICGPPSHSYGYNAPFWHHHHHHHHHHHDSDSDSDSLDSWDDEDDSNEEAWDGMFGNYTDEDDSDSDDSDMTGSSYGWPIGLAHEEYDEENSGDEEGSSGEIEHEMPLTGSQMLAFADAMGWNQSVIAFPGGSMPPVEGEGEG